MTEFLFFLLVVSQALVVVLVVAVLYSRAAADGFTFNLIEERRNSSNVESVHEEAPEVPIDLSGIGGTVKAIIVEGDPAAPANTMFITSSKSSAEKSIIVPALNSTVGTLNAELQDWPGIEARVPGGHFLPLTHDVNVTTPGSEIDLNKGALVLNEALLRVDMSESSRVETTCYSFETLEELVFGVLAQVLNTNPRFGVGSARMLEEANKITAQYARESQDLPLFEITKVTGRKVKAQ